MATANFRQEQRRVVLSGPRPSPLRISKDSHVIQKPSSSYPMPMDISSQVKVTKQQQRQPVIIYTQSPKVIHTQPRDFMALVQRLTGFSSSDHEKHQTMLGEEKECGKSVSHEDNDSSSVTSDEKYEGGEHNNGVTVNPYMAEIPLFTPNSSNLFFSPQSLLRHSDGMGPSPSMVGSLSPSFLEFLNMKELPEH